MNPVYPKDGKWYALVSLDGFMQEIGPFDTPTTAEVTAQQFQTTNLPAANSFCGGVEINQLPFYSDRPNEW